MNVWKHDRNCEQGRGIAPVCGCKGRWERDVHMPALKKEIFWLRSLLDRYAPDWEDTLICRDSYVEHDERCIPHHEGCVNSARYRITHAERDNDWMDVDAVY